MINPIVYLNGKFLSGKKAKISVFDRGFLFGDGAYEVIPVYAGKPFRLTEHLLRFKRSLEALVFTEKIDWLQLEKALLVLLQKNNIAWGDCAIYVQVTRGEAFPRSFYFTPDLKPTVFAMLQVTKVPTYEELCLGKSAITLSDIRWQCSYIKSTSLLPSVLLYDLVRRSGCDEGILIRGGCVNEGISSNVFVVCKSKVLTPVLSEKNLAGVTRDVVLQLLKQNKISCATQRITVKKLFAADEIWLTSSTRGIFPVIKLNEKIVGDGRPGAMWRRVVGFYFSFRKQCE